MFRIGSLLKRLQREASAASPEADTPSVPETPAPKLESLPVEPSLDQPMPIEEQEDDISSTSKQKRHMARRQRQRERKQLGKAEEIDLGPISLLSSAESTEEDVESPQEVMESKPSDFTSALSQTWFTSSEPGASQGHFFGSCRWSPTGDRIATVGGENGILKVFAIPEAPLSPEYLELPSSNVTQVCSSECIYDYAWYPFSNAQLEGSSLIAIGARSRPIQLWDATNGTLRASYRAYDHVERVCSPHSLAFSLDGSRIYGGFDGVIRSFPIEHPGNNYTEHWTRRDKKATARSHKRSSAHHYEGHVDNHSFNGIISTLATVPSNPNALFGGSFSGDLALFDLTTFEQHISIKVPFNVTHIKASPCGTNLYAAGRKTNQLVAFDIRMPNHILWTIQREASTNQRIGFDLDYTGSMLMSGSSDGSLKLWNLSLQADPVAVSVSGLDPIGQDGINCAQFHPFSANHYAVTTGQRRLAQFPCDSDSSSDDEPKLPDPHSQLIVSLLGSK